MVLATLILVQCMISNVTSERIVARVCSNYVVDVYGMRHAVHIIQLYNLVNKRVGFETAVHIMVFVSKWTTK
jgi:hypothetical protein